MGFYECETCKSPLMPTPSGSTCPNGHTGILPKLPRDAERVNVAILLGIPRAVYEAGKYTIPGCDGRFERGKIATGAVQKLRDTAELVHALDGGKIRQFRPVVERG